MTSKKRPLALIAIGAWVALMGTVFIVTSAEFLATGYATETGGFNAVFLAIGSVLLLIGTVLLVAIPYGLWSFKEWARKSAFWVLLINVSLGLCFNATEVFFSPSNQPA